MTYRFKFVDRSVIMAKRAVSVNSLPVTVKNDNP